MLEEITIENLGVISSAHLVLGSGLTAITGETGAGKTMLLTGLSLLMGGKADQTRVRTGASSAAVEGRVTVGVASPIRDRVTEAGGEIDEDDTLVILRTVAAAGRSRAHLGGRSVPQAVLGEVANEFVTVHGQSEQLRLRAPQRQRLALDEFLGLGHGQNLDRFRTLWMRRGAVLEEITELEERRTDRIREAELLRLGLSEIERVAPQAGEDRELESLISRLSNVEDLRSGVVSAHAAVRGDDFNDSAGPSAIDLVESARGALEGIVHVDPDLETLVPRLAEISYLLTDIGSELSGYQEGLSLDPDRLRQSQARRAELTTLIRSYGSDVDDVLAWAQEATQRMLDLEGGDDRLLVLREEESAVTEELDGLAKQLHDSRVEGARALADSVTRELEGLAMAGAQFLIEVEPLEELGPWGQDTVSMLLVPHPGAPASPLGKGASGGELSRVMLAIEVALAQRLQPEDPGVVPTFVFDEVDAGVGGRAALEVGRRLAELSLSAQVIIVTHLAQVAAFADHHIAVSKSTDGEGDVVTQSDVREVSGSDRVEELARMLSGQSDSSAARQHAAELLESAIVGR